jgi:hypothetical protein
MQRYSVRESIEETMVELEIAAYRGRSPGEASSTALREMEALRRMISQPSFDQDLAGSFPERESRFLAPTELIDAFESELASKELFVARNRELGFSSGRTPPRFLFELQVRTEETRAAFESLREVDLTQAENQEALITFLDTLGEGKWTKTELTPDQRERAEHLRTEFEAALY